MNSNFTPIKFVKTPQNYFENEARLIYKFLSLEKESDRRLTLIHMATNEGVMVNTTCLEKSSIDIKSLNLSPEIHDPVVCYVILDFSFSFFVQDKNFKANKI
jgi:hypothetical protein